MRIVFINPHEEPFVNIGLAYVMSAVEGKHKVKLLDMAFHMKKFEKYVVKELKDYGAEVVGFSVTSFSYHRAIKIAGVIRRQYPWIRLVYGGVHPTLMAEETIQHPLVDAICVGEGEDALSEYLGKLEMGREPEGVAGIWYKRPDGSIVRNALRPFREDLDGLQFPNWDHWEIEKYLKINESFVGGLRHLYSRGCPYSCTFCSNPAIRTVVPGKFFRYRSPENVIAEIKFNRNKYHKIGFKRVAFGDATFGLEREPLLRLCSLYRKENFHRDFIWHCQTRPDVITREWVSTVSESGCCMVNLGVESGDPYIRNKVYRKEFSNDCIINATRELQRQKIPYLLSLIIGCPEESAVSIRNTMALLHQIRPLKVHITFYLNFKKAQQQGIIFKSWNMPDGTTRQLTAIQMKRYMALFFMRRMYTFLYFGFKWRGVGFIKDIAIYIFSINNVRVVPLWNYCFIMGIELFTVIEYAITLHMHNNTR